jgi:hypothetical protein
MTFPFQVRAAEELAVACIGERSRRWVTDMTHHALSGFVVKFAKRNSDRSKVGNR